MQSTQTPTLIPLAFAANGTKNTIPETSQIGITNGAASLNDGFPPLTMTPIAAGGVPPSGADMNGILNLISASSRWQHAGGLYGFNSAFAADVNVGGYPSGAELQSADLQGTWLSVAENNTDNPDTGSGTKWVPGRAYGVTAIAGLTNVNVTLTPAQASKSRITLAGTLTGNIQITFPTWTKEWTVVNNTTGAFTITAKTATGTGIVLLAGQSKITGDGTNIVQPIESVATPSQFDTSNKIATMAALQRMGVQFSGYFINPTSGPIPASSAGGITAIAPATRSDAQLPDTGIPVGATFAVIIQSGATGGTIKPPTGGYFSYGDNNLGTNVAITLPANDFVVLTKISAGVYTVISGGLFSDPRFAASLTTPAGYQKLPSGLLIQSGFASSSVAAGSANPAINFPIAFPNAVLAMKLTTVQTSVTTMSAWLDAPPSLGSFVYRTSGVSGTTTYWEATGY
ncbi:hypothetical protein [Cupriavidus metallidurans]|uniref:gp53-like domain-containing protein n=1 Tax=Cupriavidus metallidurans TaxID=119219 RepID=UPI000CDFFB74|nr:hypothetical protein [Cupriavidus metallidurans]AVA33026.1 hypothetical protein C3Z06_04910 [Cupriavidus metallidurans]